MVKVQWRNVTPLAAAKLLPLGSDAHVGVGTSAINNFLFVLCTNLEAIPFLSPPCLHFTKNSTVYISKSDGRGLGMISARVAQERFVNDPELPARTLLEPFTRDGLNDTEISI